MTNAVQLCIGNVSHTRLRPTLNHFRYPVFFLRVCLNDETALRASSHALFGYERARLVSFHARDHGNRDGGTLLDWLDERLVAAGLQLPSGRVVLQAFPRVLGFTFKPVSFWLCYDAANALRILVAEVNNTFGERHQYVLTAPNGEPINNDTELVCRKVFHVSPFCEVRGEYRFRIRCDGDRHVAVIDYYDDPDGSAPLIKTAMSGTASSATRAAVLACVLRMPLLMFGVVARIHWQALRLWLKGVRFYRKPAPPDLEMTHNIEAM